ncbi:SAM-dependent methyltransferase [Neolewinella sp.]|uniref:SAM-dependent methyltransferase n=1 Tax=Neolewinella sp. TaxID=2993543 RepID=UPI003B52A5A8
MSEFWNDRYAAPDYAYGTAPNAFFAEQLRLRQPAGRILLPADGEGRNSVYAAEQGLEVHAFDLSAEGQRKAMQLANQRQVAIDYKVGEFLHFGYHEGTFDVLALIYAHFPAKLKEDYNRRLATYLRTGGLLIFEAFGQHHLSYRQDDPKVGGPGVAEMLFSTEELRRTFPHFEVYHLAEEAVALSEGNYHQGTGSVVRFVGRKL